MSVSTANRGSNFLATVTPSFNLTCSGVPLVGKSANTVSHTSTSPHASRLATRFHHINLGHLNTIAVPDPHGHDNNFERLTLALLIGLTTLHI